MLDRSLVTDLVDLKSIDSFSRLPNEKWKGVAEILELNSRHALVAFGCEEMLDYVMSYGLMSVSSVCSGLKCWCLQAWSFSRSPQRHG